MHLKPLGKILLLSLLAMACGEEEVTKAREREFVPGGVMVGIKADVEISEVFDFFNERELVIDQMSGFFNYSTFPNDSLDFVISELAPKEYLNKRGFSGGSAFISAIEHRITVTEFLFEMDANAQQDWLETLKKLQLQNLENDSRNLALDVPAGTEQYWLNELKKHRLVKWVELNYISGHEPL